MGVLWGVIAVLVAFLVIVSIADLVRRHAGAGKTAAWIVLILCLPFFGAVIYWLMRPAASSEVDLAEQAESEIRRGSPPPGNTRLGS
jgi:hypothetical protein